MESSMLEARTQVYWVISQELNKPDSSPGVLTVGEAIDELGQIKDLINHTRPLNRVVGNLLDRIIIGSATDDELLEGA